MAGKNTCKEHSLRDTRPQKKQVSILHKPREPRSVCILFPYSYAPSGTHRVNTQPCAINSTIQKLNILCKTDRILKCQHAASWKNQIVSDFCSVTPGYLITKSTTAYGQPATNIEWAVKKQKQELGDARSLEALGTCPVIVTREKYFLLSEWGGSHRRIISMT